jgi:hypothetical protein
MSMQYIRDYRNIISKEELQNFFTSLVITIFLFSPFIFVSQIYAASVTLTATVATTLSFTTSTNQFPALTPGTYVFATTTLDVSTNDLSGWFVTLSGVGKTTVNNNLRLSTNPTVQIPDQTEWVPGSATTSAGNAVLRTNLDSSGNVLAFRVMTASTTNSSAFTSSSWWGNSDLDAAALWAGISSSTIERQIGNAGSGSYSASRHLNTLQYYVNVAVSQLPGTYDAVLTITATGN